MNMIKMQCSGTALLLLVSPWIPHQTLALHAPVAYINYHLKRRWFGSTRYTAVRINNCLKKFSNQSNHKENFGRLLL